MKSNINQLDATRTIRLVAICRSITMSILELFVLSSAPQKCAYSRNTNTKTTACGTIGILGPREEWAEGLITVPRQIGFGPEVPKPKLPPPGKRQESWFGLVRIMVRYNPLGKRLTFMVWLEFGVITC